MQTEENEADIKNKFYRLDSNICIFLRFLSGEFALSSA